MSIFWKGSKRQLVPKNKLTSKTIVLLGLFLNLAFVCYVNVFFFTIWFSFGFVKEILGFLLVIYYYLGFKVYV